MPKNTTLRSLSAGLLFIVAGVYVASLHYRVASLEMELRDYAADTSRTLALQTDRLAANNDAQTKSLLSLRDDLSDPITMTKVEVAETRSTVETLRQTTEADASETALYRQGLHTRLDKLAEAVLTENTIHMGLRASVEAVEENLTAVALEQGQLKTSLSVQEGRIQQLDKLPTSLIELQSAMSALQNKTESLAATQHQAMIDSPALYESSEGEYR